MFVRERQHHVRPALGGWAQSILFLSTAALFCPAVVQAQSVEPRVEVLDNGLKLLLVERHEEPAVAAGLFYNVGGVNDPAGKSGIAHLFEHMLFKGTKIIGTNDIEAEEALIGRQDSVRAKMIAEEYRMREMMRLGQIKDVLDPEEWTADYKSLKADYDALVEEHRSLVKNNELANLYTSNGGTGLNAGTMNDATMYFIQVPSNKLELFFWIESDRMANGVMREFYIERDNVREERRLRTESTPTGRFDEAFEAMFWQSHPYGIPVLGWPSEVETITRKDVSDFYKIYYAPNNATMVLVGDFDSDRVVEMAKRYFGRIPRGETVPAPVITEEPRPIAERRFYAEAETNPRLRMRYHTVAMGHKDEATLDVLAELLSGKSGRLYKRLVAAEDVAIGVPGGAHLSRKYAGFFEIFITIKEGRDPVEVERMVLEEIENLCTGEIGDRELQKVKNQVLADSVRQLKSNFGLMFRLGIFETWLDWQYINEAPKRMLAVTPDDVKRVVKEYFDAKTRTVAIYRTKEATEADTGEIEIVIDEELESILARFQAVEMQNKILEGLKGVRNSTNIADLTKRAEDMERWSGMIEIAEAQRYLFAYGAKLARIRIAELEAMQEEESK